MNHAMAAYAHVSDRAADEDARLQLSEAGLAVRKRRRPRRGQRPFMRTIFYRIMRRDGWSAARDWGKRFDYREQRQVS